jgi:hypothetical protein
MVQVWAGIVGYRPVQFNTEEGANIYHLKELIKEKMPQKFGRIDIDEILIRSSVDGEPLIEDMIITTTTAPSATSMLIIDAPQDMKCTVISLGDNDILHE